MTGSTASTCDVVVIGGGLSGLVAAALLSRAGLQVVVVEEQPNPGGYLAGFRRRGFKFDGSVVWLNQCGPGGFVDKVFDFIGTDCPRCRPLRSIRRYKGGSFDYLLTSSPEELKADFVGDLPGEAAGFDRFFSDAEVLSERWKVLGRRWRSVETMNPLQKMAHGTKMAHWVAPIWRHLGTSAEKGLQRYFQSSAMEKVFCTESQFMSILMPIAWAFAGDVQAPPIGGSQAFITWLIEQVRGVGSEVRLGTPVERVSVAGRRAVGVVLEGGERIRSRYVIAACDAESLYSRLLPQGQVSRAKTPNFRDADLYPSHVSIYLGLDRDVGTWGFGEELVCLTEDGVSRQEQTGGNPHKTALNVISPTVRDPSLAPDGKGTLTIQCSADFEHDEHWHSEPGLVRGAAYREHKQKFVEAVIERVEGRLLPGLRQHIEVTEAATPLTFHRYTRNYKGSIMGTKPSRRNVRNKLAGHITPVQNLLLAGHWSDYGGGVPVATKTAANASLLILRELAPSAYRDLAALMAQD